MSGIITANNKNTIVGFSYRSKLYFAKVIDDNGECNFNSVVAAILWAIVKDVDVIMMAFGTEYDYEILHDAIKKAYDNNICIVAAAGNEVNKVNFPAQYKEVFSVGATKNKEKIDFILPNKNYFTTYLDNSYVKVSGSSISTSVITSLTSLLIEECKKEVPPKRIFYELNKILK